MRSLSALFLFLGAVLGPLAPPARAQGTGTLAGQVLESDGVTAVIGANVRVDGTTLGAATDLDGRFRIIGVPAGAYTVTASYAGYQSQTVTVVEIAAGATREITFTLSAGTLDSVEIVYEAPLITNDAIGQSRIVSPSDDRGGRRSRPRNDRREAGRQQQEAARQQEAQRRAVVAGSIENLPIRSVAATVALQGGVVSTEGSSDLNVRGGRAEEVEYFVDGVRVSSSQLGVNQQAAEQQDVLTGWIPARYADTLADAPTPGTGVPEAPFRFPAAPEAVREDPAVLAGEDYAAVEEVAFRRPEAAPLSTFSIDVDRASYANVRRMLGSGYLPPPEAVRVEEFVNAFELDMAGPTDGSPFAVHTEVAVCPWAPEHRLVRVGIQGRRALTEDLPPANLVFLIDVSGSMSSEDKLPLLVSAFRRLVGELRVQDHVSIVVYAGAAGLVLPPTSGADKATILAALDRLQAGGSTAGAAGIELAYAVARQHFDPAATNRVLLATDGDFNVGVTSEGALQRLVETERASGVLLSVFGLGTGNLQDARMEALAAWGNGAYSYLDSEREAERVFVREIGGTLVAIAKDVKVQVEFNPATVAGYRLVGYDNRILPDEAFADDARDAAELGMGHHVTALYEVVPAGADESGLPPAQRLRYQRQTERDSGDLLTVQLRYKPAVGPGTFADESVLMTVPVAAAAGAPSEATAWTAAVAEAALVLRHSAYAPGASLAGALARARAAQGTDPDGDRAEFVRLLERAAALTEAQPGEQALRRD
ncbi:MAG TPA: von Willebrand factor type A domain-containing protein [Rubricoccaceae bacterium]